jgi:hypothetical protein
VTRSRQEEGQLVLLFDTYMILPKTRSPVAAMRICSQRKGMNSATSIRRRNTKRRRRITWWKCARSQEKEREREQIISGDDHQCNWRRKKTKSKKKERRNRRDEKTKKKIKRNDFVRSAKRETGRDTVGERNGESY